MHNTWRDTKGHHWFDKSARNEMPLIQESYGNFTTPMKGIQHVNAHRDTRLYSRIGAVARYDINRVVEGEGFVMFSDQILAEIKGKWVSIRKRIDQAQTRILFVYNLVNGVYKSGDEQLREKPVQPDRLMNIDPWANLEFIPDSQEQITQSVYNIGYSYKLTQAFKKAITKAKETIQQSRTSVIQLHKSRFCSVAPSNNQSN